MANLKHEDNETIKLLRNRRSIRKFNDVQITEEQLNILLDSAFSAPSGCNKQPWHITIVQNQKLLTEISVDTLKRIHEASGKEISKNVNLFYHAPTVLFISYDESNSWAPFDIGILAGNITTAAEALGLGSCIIGMIRGLFTPVENGDVSGLISVLNPSDVTDSIYSEDKIDTNKKYRSLLQIPKGYAVPFAISVGNPNCTLEPRNLTYKVTRL